MNGAPKGCDCRLKGPALCAAEQGCGGEVWQTGPVGHVEAGARVDLIAGGGVVMLGESVDDLTAGCFLFGPRGAGPVEQKTLAADLAADVADVVGDFAENLHGMEEPLKKGLQCL